MRIVYIIMLIFCYALKASAAESPKLTFIPEGATEYIQEMTLDGEFIEVLRPLKEFKVGKKYCLWGSDNWDDACQDAAMEYVYGSRWQEFKQVTIEFLELTKQDRLAETSKLFEFGEFGAYITDYGKDKMETTTFKNAKEFEYYMNVKHLKLWRNLANNKKYKEFFMDPCLLTYRYCTFLSNELAIVFDLQYQQSLDKYIFVPKINSVLIFY